MAVFVRYNRTFKASSFLLSLKQERGGGLFGFNVNRLYLFNILLNTNACKCLQIVINA